MKEYYQCKRCYSLLFVGNIAKHHTLTHPDVPHDIYLDNFFNLDHPLYKCDFCSCKLTQKRLIKHLQRAHLFDNHPYKTTNSLPFTQAVPASNSKMTVIELSSESEDERRPQAKKAKQMIDKEVQCDGINGFNGRLVDKCIGTHYKMVEKAVNCEQIKTKEIAIQSSMEQCMSPIKSRMQLSLEYDEDDGWVGLVLN